MVNEKFTNYLNQWEVDVPFSEGYEDRISEIKSGMLEKQTIKPIEMLKYQRLILKCIERSESISLPAFTEEELNKNFYICDEYPTGIKVTKYVNKIINARYNLGRQDSRLDYFNKLRYDDNEYYIDSNPFLFVELYRNIQTCVSPGGENQGNIFRLLASPYIYIAYDKRKKVRTLIFADDKNKRVFLNPVYGEYDLMFIFSIVDHYIKLGYSFIKDIELYFENDSIYKDSDELSFSDIVEFMGAQIFSDSMKVYPHLLDRPSWITFEGDVYTGKIYDNMRLTTYEDFYEMYECYKCGGRFYEDDYDFDSECCHSCSDVYCDVCDEYFDQEHYDWDYDCCRACADEEREREKELERQDKEEDSDV